MPTYDSKLFNPQKPIAEARVRNPERHAAWLKVPILLEFGAGVGLVPREAAYSKSVRLASDRRYELVAFNGRKSLAPVVRLDLNFRGHILRWQFLLIDQNYGILGCNILNAARLLSNGPMLEWHEQN